MDQNLQQIISNLLSADEALLHAPPQSLDFMAAPDASGHHLAPVDCNASLIHYLRVLYRLRDASVRPPPSAPLPVCLDFSSLHVSVVGRIQLVYKYLGDCFMLLSTRKFHTHLPA
jgi:hypothetical protein